MVLEMSGPWTNRKKHKVHEQLVDQTLGTSSIDKTAHFILRITHSNDKEDEQ
jgi:hypothetical protein